MPDQTETRAADILVHVLQTLGGELVEEEQQPAQRDHITLPLFAGKPHHEVGDEGFQIKAMDDAYTDDITTCAGVRTRTYEHLTQATFQVGNRALADVIASSAYQIGVREMDRLELAKDLEGMKIFGRQWLKELTAIARGEEG